MEDEDQSVPPSPRRPQLPNSRPLPPLPTLPPLPPLPSPVDVDSSAAIVEEEDEERSSRYPSRVVLPAVPPALAEAFCLLNCFAPGLGTFLSSISCCCARTRGMTKTEVVSSIFVGMFLALLQLVLTAFLCLGWIWSCFWGILLTAQSDAFYKPHDQQSRRHRGILQNPLSSAQTHPEQPPPYTFYDDYFQRGQTPPPPYSLAPPENTVVQEVAQPIVEQPVSSPPYEDASNPTVVDELPLARIDPRVLDRPNSAPSTTVRFVSETGSVPVPARSMSNDASSTLPDVC